MYTLVCQVVDFFIRAFITFIISGIRWIPGGRWVIWFLELVSTTIPSCPLFLCLPKCREGWGVSFHQVNTFFSQVLRLLPESSQALKTSTDQDSSKTARDSRTVTRMSSGEEKHRIYVCFLFNLRTVTDRADKAKKRALVLNFIKSYVTLLEESRAEVLRNVKNDPSVIPPYYRGPNQFVDPELVSSSLS
jgi:hypothetical protein